MPHPHHSRFGDSPSKPSFFPNASFSSSPDPASAGFLPPVPPLLRHCHPRSASTLSSVVADLTPSSSSHCSLSSSSASSLSSASSTSQSSSSASISASTSASASSRSFFRPFPKTADTITTSTTATPTGYASIPPAVVSASTAGRPLAGMSSTRSSYTLAAKLEAVAAMPRSQSLYSPHYDDDAGEGGTYGNFSPSLYLYDHASPFSTNHTPTDEEHVSEPLNDTGDVTSTSDGVMTSFPSCKTLGPGSPMYDPFFSPSTEHKRPPLANRSTGSYISSRLSIRPTPSPSFLSYRSTTGSEPSSPTESVASSSSSFSSSCQPPPIPLSPVLQNHDQLDPPVSLEGSPRSHAPSNAHYHYHSQQAFPNLTSNLTHARSSSSCDTTSSSAGPRSPRSPVPSSFHPPSPGMLTTLASPTKETYADSLRRHTRQMMVLASGGVAADLDESSDGKRNGGGPVIDPGPSPRARKPDAWKGALYRGTMVYREDQEHQPTY